MNGNWSTPRRFGAVTARPHVGPQVAMNPRGLTILVYVEGGDRIMAVVRPVARHWGRPVLVSRRNGGGDGPVVALDNAGAATVAWRAQSELSQGSLAVRRSGGGSWTTPERIDPSYPNESFVTLTIAANGPGDVILAWSRWSADIGERAYAVFRPQAGRWGAPKLLTGRNRWAPVTSLARNGDAVAMWTASGSVQARYRTK